MKKLQSLKEELFQTLELEKLKTIFGGRAATTDRSYCSCKGGGCPEGDTSKDDGLETID